MRVWSDSDSAGSVKESQSSLNIEVDGCLLSSASRKQKERAHSSGEAHYAAASVTRDAKLTREVLLVMELEVRTEFLLDSAPVHGTCIREGVVGPYVICDRKFFGFSIW